MYSLSHLVDSACCGRLESGFSPRVCTWGFLLRMYGQAGVSGEFGARFEAIGRMDGVDG